jgi:hypothetical protein
MLKLLYTYILDTRLDTRKCQPTVLCLKGLLGRNNQHNDRLQQFAAPAMMLLKDTVLLDLLHLRDGMSGNRQQFC